MASKLRKDSPRHKPAWRRGRRWWLVGLGLVLVAAYAAYVKLVVEPGDRGVGDLFAYLEDLGYTPNWGLSGIYQPGTVIQTVEEGPGGGTQALASPLVLVYADACFPDLAPRPALLPLPESSGEAAASLHLGGERLARLLPSFELGNEAIGGYRLEVERPQVSGFAKGELSGHLSATCVETLNRVRDDGDRLEWFQVIQEVVLAEALVFEIEWRSETSAKARAALAKRAGENLARTAGKGGRAASVEVAVAAVDAERTRLVAEGPVVLAYRPRPLDIPGGALRLRPEVDAGSDMAERLQQAFEVPADARPRQVVGRIALQLVLRDEDSRQRSTRWVAPDYIFHTGDDFRFEVETSRDGWLFLLHRSPGGEVQLLWPAAEEIAAGSAANRLLASQRILVPPNETFYFHSVKGDELFYLALVATAEAPALAEVSYQDQLGTSTMARQERPANYSVRRLAERASRGVSIAAETYEPPYLYFEAAPADAKVAAVRFWLRHE